MGYCNDHRMAKSFLAFRHPMIIIANRISHSKRKRSLIRDQPLLRGRRAKDLWRKTRWFRCRYFAPAKFLQYNLLLRFFAFWKRWTSGISTVSGFSVFWNSLHVKMYRFSKDLHDFSKEKVSFLKRKCIIFQKKTVPENKSTGRNFYKKRIKFTGHHKSFCYYRKSLLQSVCCHRWALQEAS